MSLRVFRILGLVLVMAMVLPGCAVKRDLPPVADAATLRSLDVCALAPYDEVKQSHPDLKFNYGGRLQLRPDSCWFSIVGLGYVWLEPFGATVPKDVGEEGREGVTVEEPPGGMLVNSTEVGAQPCDHHLVSNNGIRLSVNLPGTIPAKRQDQACALSHDVAEMALARLDSGIPTIEWPAGSLYTKDICAAVQQSGVIEALGIETELQAVDSGRSCEIDYDRDADFYTLSVSARVGSKLGKPSEPKDITVAGHSASYSPSLCHILVDFGTNDALSARGSQHESLQIEATPADGGDCQQLIDSLGPLVERLSAA